MSGIRTGDRRRERLPDGGLARHRGVGDVRHHRHHGRAVAEPAGTNSVLLKQVRIERVLLDGSRELLIEAPECIFHIESKEVTSAGPVAAKSGDDRYQLSGEGFRFLYRGTNSSLIISNNGRTTILGLGADALKP